VRPTDGQTDWQDAGAYAPLFEADRSIFAWEWLRRDPAYRTAALDSLQGSGGADAVADERQRPESWGLHAFEQPDRGAPLARPVWTAAVHPPVLPAAVCRAGASEDMLDLEAFGSRAMIVPGRFGRRHLLLSDGLNTIRLDILAGTLGARTNLRYRISGLASAEPRLLTLRRLIAFCRDGRFSRQLHPAEPKARRWILLLRTSDALSSGADQRQIAELLLSAEAREVRWRSRSPSLRSQAQRLVHGARRMAADGYRALLR
jgi:hypothetical protein